MKKCILTFLAFAMLTLAATAFSPFSISGYFYYNNATNTPMDNVKVILKLNGGAIDSTYTSDQGFYQFSGLGISTYTITASSAKSWEGVNGTDALKVQRHFAGIELLTVPVRLSAADVNNSGSVNGTDALKIKRRFAGLDTGFDRGDWTFEKVNGGNTIVILGTDVTQDFYGLCTGDVNGSNTPLPGLPCPGLPSVTYDGKTYNTVQIGTQCWMAQNLNAGNRINSTSNQANNGIIEKYCYNNLEANCDIYGGLYLWNEMMQYNTTPGVQGICPPDWHLPTDAEWTTLTTFLGGESVAGGAMKETGTAHWFAPNTGATNSSLFTGLPGGVRQSNTSFTGVGMSGYWWSSTMSSGIQSWDRLLSLNSASAIRVANEKTFGLSVRCVSGTGPVSLPTVSTNEVSDVTLTSGTCGGIVLTTGGAAVTERGVCWSTLPSPTISGSHTSDGSGTGSFTSSITGLTPVTTYYVRAYATNSFGTGYGNEVSFTSTVFYIGMSFGGGVIFYIDATGNHGLISSTSDQSTNAAWGCYGTLINGTSTAIGTGQANTTSIVSGCSTAGIAARICDNLVLNGYSDWFLPSADELNRMYTKKALIGGFGSGSYWSSSEYTLFYAYIQAFSDGYTNTGYKFDTYSVRAVRAF